MSRILVIEPNKVLQHAFAAALCAEHQLTISEKIPEAVPNAELAIIDAAALRERKSLSTFELGVIQGWHVPVVWVDSDDHAEVPALDRLTRIKLPLDRESLKRALLAVRATPGAPNPPTSVEIPRPDRQSGKKPRVKQVKTGGAHEKFIELVDVVEEIAAEDGSQMETLKKE